MSWKYMCWVPSTKSFLKAGWCNLQVLFQEKDVHTPSAFWVFSFASGWGTVKGNRVGVLVLDKEENLWNGGETETKATPGHSENIAARNWRIGGFNMLSREFFLVVFWLLGPHTRVCFHTGLSQCLTPQNIMHTCTFKRDLRGILLQLEIKTHLRTPLTKKSPPRWLGKWRWKPKNHLFYGFSGLILGKIQRAKCLTNPSSAEICKNNNVLLAKA